MSANKLIKEWGLVIAKSIMSSNEDSEVKYFATGVQLDKFGNYMVCIELLSQMQNTD